MEIFIKLTKYNTRQQREEGKPLLVVYYLAFLEHICEGLQGLLFNHYPTRGACLVSIFIPSQQHPNIWPFNEVLSFKKRYLYLVPFKVPNTNEPTHNQKMHVIFKLWMVFIIYYLYE